MRKFGATMSVLSGMKNFDRWIDILDRESFSNMRGGRFVEALRFKGFFRSEKKFPFATSMLSGSMRVGLEMRGGEIAVLIDEDAMIRK